MIGVLPHNNIYNIHIYDNHEMPQALGLDDLIFIFLGCSGKYCKKTQGM